MITNMHVYAFAYLLKQSNDVKRFTTQLSAPKKEIKQAKGVNSAAVRAFLERKEKEEEIKSNSGSCVYGKQMSLKVLCESTF